MIVLLSALVAFGPLSIDMYLPSLPFIAQDMETSISEVQQTITLFLIGFSLGMLLYGPLSDYLGRKRLLLIGIIIYLIATFGCIVSSHIEHLQLFRLLQAIGGASASVLSRALVRDLFNNAEIPHILSFMHIMTISATLVAPILGAWITEYWHWNGIFIFLFCYALICLIWSKIAIDSPQCHHVSTGIIENYRIVVANRTVWGLMLSNAFSFGGMFAYITASSFVFIEYYHFTPTQYAYLFGFNLCAIIIFTLCNSYALKYTSAFKLLKIMASISGLSGLYLIGIIYFNLHTVIWLMIGLAIFVGVTGAIGANAMANLLKILPQQAGTASGLSVSIQFAIGALMSFWVSILFPIYGPNAMNIIIGISACLCVMSLFLTRHLSDC
ncbi:MULTISPECIES: multidrug effflux MFS transporter [unclassified Acinetobacter]|uniref:multidrug effflux MFS transporter n=1 Tax=unclassified Acinetobacter TaxID=196816 RepID=UPI0029344548|nr:MULTISPECIES: multidrug effflux MFS transporter [unclassified Acinetobacter]WOE33226.1 multidrug effflux MFS transporter [Acinetobacter sp. SAAs470]WOE36993.1 multidrug effflux MFS transporter [Acinetobacter sp. SAAs474]